MYLETILDDFYKLNRELNKIFETGNRERFYNNWPEANIYENQNEYMVVIGIPGLTKENISITYKDNAIQISGEKKRNENENFKYHLKEIRNGKFERTFYLQEKIDVEKIEAKIENGLLLIKLQKSPESKPKAIEIK